MKKKNDREWIIDHFRADYKYGAKTNQRSWGKKKADDVLFKCLQCKKVWEYDKTTKHFLYYDNFPSYGKTRKVCPRCKDQNH